ncbi:MAG: FG-GAP repeat protein [Ignavibacteria bacterium]|nr:FG-GAP repeat protein [Ignavibacteria bacterium]
MACVSGAGDVNGDSYDDVVVSTYIYDSDRGAAFIFYGGNSMHNNADVTLTGEASGNAFGISISGAGDVNGDGYDDVISGACAYDNLRGRSYIYFGGPAMNNVADVIFTGETIQEDFGNSVSCAGDVNNDGFDDVIVGAQFFNNYYGRAYIYFGAPVMNNVADVVMTGETNSTLGKCVSDCGDVNGDGYDDVIIGPNISGGRVWIYYGGAVMNNTADIVITGQSAFGWSVSGAGDVNSDGYSDVLIGTYGYASATGKADIYFGGNSMDTIPDITMKGEYINSFFGASVSGAGDLNNDGYTDMIIGSANLDKAYIYLSSPPDNRKNLFLFGAIQGMYDPVLNTEVPDTIKVYLRNSTSPYARVDSSINILLGPQTGQYFLFRNAQNGIPYYVEVTHRNALTTWSASPVSFVNSDASIAYSVDAIYAYGNNEIQVDNSPYNVFAFYSGDVNQDGTIDASDVSEVDNDSYISLSGYVNTDVTGDNFVDAADVSIVDNNAFSAVSVVRP